jgi:hypothetical protein
MPFALRFLLATDPESLTQVLGIVYRAISGFILRKARLTPATGETGAVRLVTDITPIPRNGAVQEGRSKRLFAVFAARVPIRSARARDRRSCGRARADCAFVRDLPALQRSGPVYGTLATVLLRHFLRSRHKPQPIVPVPTSKP